MKKKRMFNKVAIIGVGLIGGSIGMAIKRNKLAKQVVGLSRRRSTLKKALKYRAIDKATQNIKSAVSGADLVILAAPVNSIIKLAPKIIKHINKDCILTDVGSSKLEIVRVIEPRLSKNIKFIPTHPLAGSERKGVEFGSFDLFVDSVCIFTPTKKASIWAIKRLKKLWKSLGAETVIMSASRHDEILSFISHLPHVLTFSLMNSIPKKYLKFSSRGLRDTTRIAASDPLVWRDICLTNSRQILRVINIFGKHLAKLKRSIKNKSSGTILNTFRDAKAKRESLQKNR